MTRQESLAWALIMASVFSCLETAALAQPTAEGRNASKLATVSASGSRVTWKLAVVPAQPLVESGSFSIVQGAVVVAGEVERESKRPGGLALQQLQRSDDFIVAARGLQAVMQLQPVRYEYRRDNALQLPSGAEHVGFAAEAVQQIIPEAVSRTGSGYLQIDNDPILWAMLNAIEEQQAQIAQLQEEVRQLRTASRRGQK